MGRVPHTTHFEGLEECYDRKSEENGSDDPYYYCSDGVVAVSAIFVITPVVEPLFIMEPW